VLLNPDKTGAFARYFALHAGLFTQNTVFHSFYTIQKYPLTGR
jgi:hypothetical protein